MVLRLQRPRRVQEVRRPDCDHAGSLGTANAEGVEERKLRALSRKNQGPQRRDKQNERRPGDIITVAWMVSVMATTACGGVALLLWSLAQIRPVGPGALLFAALLHFSALVSAIVSLVLLGVVLKVRNEPPPAPVTYFAVAAALATILAAFLYR